MKLLLLLALALSNVAVAAVIKKVSLGAYHSCVLFETGKIKCWGYNASGQLGLGDNKTRGLLPEDMGSKLPYVNLGNNRKAKDIVSSSTTNCALLDDDSIKCWGLNNVGQLGVGDIKDRGLKPTDMGNSLPAVLLGTTAKPKAIYAGGNHFCAVFVDGKLKCWGANPGGQLGLGNKDVGYGSDKKKLGNSLPFVNLGTGAEVKDLALSSNFSCALLKSNRVKCWGNNGYVFGIDGVFEMIKTGDELPELKLDYSKPIQSIGAGYNHLCATYSPSDIRCWGYGAYGTLLNGNGGSVLSVTDLKPLNFGNLEHMQLSTGGYKTCAVLQNATVKCWGYNLYGQLGLEDTRQRGDRPSEIGEGLQTVDLGYLYSAHAVSSNIYHTCAILEDDDFKPTQLKCWGYNLYGQLGLGNKIYYGSMFGTMGDNLPVVKLE